MKGQKFIETLNITFEKQSGNKKIMQSAYFNSKAQTIINKTQIQLALKLSKEQIFLNGYQKAVIGLLNLLTNFTLVLLNINQ